MSFIASSFCPLCVGDGMPELVSSECSARIQSLRSRRSGKEEEMREDSSRIFVNIHLPWESSFRAGGHRPPNTSTGILLPGTVRIG